MVVTPPTRIIAMGNKASGPETFSGHEREELVYTTPTQPPSTEHSPTTAPLKRSQTGKYVIVEYIQLIDSKPKYLFLIIRKFE